MMTNSKQPKITKLFRKLGAKLPEDCEEVQQRINASEEKLRALHNEWFQIERQKHKRNISSSKPKSKDVFIRPQKIVLKNSVETLKRKLELSSMLTGLEVQSFQKGEHCCIVYYMKHDLKHEIKHGLRIEMKSGGNEVTESSLPLGFDLNSIIEDYDNILKPEYLVSIQRGLIAYYERLEQYDELKMLLSLNGSLFKTLDGSQMEITFPVQNDEDETVQIKLILHYRVHDIRPRKLLIKAELPQEDLDGLQQLCAVFKQKPLHKAFKTAFITSTGSWKLVPQLGVGKKNVPQVRTKRFKPNKNPNIDDTFHPEECSDQGEDEENA